MYIYSYDLTVYIVVTGESVTVYVWCCRLATLQVAHHVIIHCLTCHYHVYEPVTIFASRTCDHLCIVCM